MALPDGYAVRRDTLFEGARRLVKDNPEAFAEAAAQLEEMYSEEASKERAPILADLTGRRCLLGRLNLACRDAVTVDGGDSEYSWRFDFDLSGDPGQRRAAARRYVLVILLSADYHANEVIHPEWAELASLH